MHLEDEISPMAQALIEEIDSVTDVAVGPGYLVIGTLAIWPSGGVSLLAGGKPGPLVPLSAPERAEISSATRAAIRREFERRIARYRSKSCAA